MIATTYYSTNSGRRRTIRLYKSWRNLNGRACGVNHDGRGNRRWAGLPVGWKSFREFREWALANGYSKTRNSLDRIDEKAGYTPANCQWITRGENTRKAMRKRWA
jgi:hypothetical protein